VTVSEVVYRVGFNSRSYFNTCFNKYYGYPPGKVKRISSFGVAKKYPISRKFIFFSIASLIVIAAILVLFLETRITDKSIAVLPLKSLGDDPGRQYLADGMMDAIRQHLSKIEDLTVIDRTSVEQYRGSNKTAITICKELDVAYLLEGSFQKYGDRARLNVRLIHPGKKGHAWSNEYDREWNDIFDVQSEVAQLVAKELQAVISPEERQLIKKIPTTSLTAWDFYQRGREEQYKYWLNRDNKEALKRAEYLYHKAVESDSSFAQAYTGLAWVHLNKYSSETVVSESLLDSTLIIAEIALSFDDQLAEAYLVRGNYYNNHNQKDRALIEYDKAIQLNPNEWLAYWMKGWLYVHDTLAKSIDNFQKAASLHRGPLLPSIFRQIGSTFARAGFKDKANYYAKEVLELDDDSARYYSDLASIEATNGNYEKAIEFGEKSSTIDSTNSVVIYMLGMYHSFFGLYEESLEYFKKFENKFETLDRLEPPVIFRIGYAFWVNGFKEEAEDYFNTALEFHNKKIELGQDYSFYELAALYAFQGDKDKAYENLRILNQNESMSLLEVTYIKNDPLFDSIRNEPDFQPIVKDVEAKYQAEHERVRQWLEENDL